MNASEVERRLGELIQFGVVSEVRPELGKCRLSLGLRTTPLVRWLETRANSGVKTFSHPRIGEQALFLAPAGDSSQGVALLGVFSGLVPLPPGAAQDVEIVQFGDGACLCVDQAGHVISLTDHYGSFIKFENGDIIIKAAGNIYLN